MESARDEACFCIPNGPPDVVGVDGNRHDYRVVPFAKK